MAWKYDTSIRFTKPQQTPLQYNSYTIKRGDTLGAIAKAYGTDINTLLKWNPQIKDANKIYAGASLNVMGPSEPLFKETTPVRIARKAPAPQKSEVQLARETYNSIPRELPGYKPDTSSFMPTGAVEIKKVKVERPATTPIQPFIANPVSNNPLLAKAVSNITPDANQMITPERLHRV